MPPWTASGCGRVLLADDDAFMRSIVASIIRSALGCDVDVAGSGRDALERLGLFRPPIGLALLDFVMPDGNGLEVARAIRTGHGPVPRDLPIVMLTGRTDGALVRAAMELDVNGYVVKPVTREALLARLERAASIPFDIKPVDVYRAVEIPDPAAAEPVRRHPPAPAPVLPSPPAPTEAHPRSTRVEVPVARLEPGMILATAVRAHDGGSTILPAHIRLDHALIARLGDLADMHMIPPVAFVIASREG
ncbi:response regulator [Azospirillum halopraeferens]|uniref:response regulator n=1 Tax=Azospirillum halopraeferens TaxID=34010 RepID=UPI00040DC11F|nr:response regulator [Azospirillum halopraeferens]